MRRERGGSMSRLEGYGLFSIALLTVLAAVGWFLVRSDTDSGAPDKSPLVSAKVLILECPSTSTADAGVPGRARLRVTNMADESSNFSVDLVTESGDSTTRYERHTLVVDALEPGQSTEVEAPLSRTPAGATCRVSSARRSATGEAAATAPTLEIITTSTAATGGSPTTISRGFGSRDASADVSILACPSLGSGGVADWGAPRFRVTNNSSKRSDYSIEYVSESTDRSMQYEWSIVFVRGLEPGQSTDVEDLLTRSPANAVCRITEVQRTASS